MRIWTYANRYIYGGGLFTGTAYERVLTGEGLVSESVKNGLPVIYVAMNYRLNSRELYVSQVTTLILIYISLWLRSFRAVKRRKVSQCRFARSASCARLGAKEYCSLRRRQRQGNDIWSIIWRSQCHHANHCLRGHPKGTVPASDHRVHRPGTHADE